MCNKQAKRVAFLTTEFPTDYKDGGGLSNYLGRITITLAKIGCLPEVFLLSENSAESFEWNGVIVHRIPYSTKYRPYNIYLRLSKLIPLLRIFSPLARMAKNSAILAAAFSRREQEVEFSFIQCADYLSTGLFVKRQIDRPLVVRCSSAAELYANADGDNSDDRKWETWLEIQSIRRADFAYAPSKLVAGYYATKHGLNLSVIRPPVFMEISHELNMCEQLPERYFMHFGQLRRRKGTSWLAAALPLAWEQEPELQIVFVGNSTPDDRKGWERLWGPRAGNVHWLGSRNKAELYAILKQAEAAVLPSLVDNLPNTVIESLACGIPVIGTAGASIDELVDDGETGILVPSGDESALADAMVRQWRGLTTVRKGFAWHRLESGDMSPVNAIEALFHQVGLVHR
ncbi:MAG: glycosyltransferase family 4 protein [Chlorobium sp.]|nr:glycosyltransferase family 4 protein [Chlorobium sp.]